MASTFLTAIGPYLRIKRRQAQLCSELRRLKDRSRKAPLAYAEVLAAAMVALRAEILRLNQVKGRALRTSRENVGESHDVDGLPLLGT